MRATLLARLPEDMHGMRLLDAGCGTGALAVEAARRGADVLAVDISASLLAVAVDRLPPEVAPRIRFQAGDMLDARLGFFDHVVAMDSLIHYRAPDIASALARLAEPHPRLDRLHRRARDADAPGDALRRPRLPPRRPLARHRAGDDRPPRPALAPLADWRLSTHRRVSSGFYISQAMELAP
jgi:magnesium-protoporphyrin O-methyltransferase